MSKTRKKSSKRGRRWSAKVTKHSDALDLDRDVFKEKDPRKIALSLKRSAQRSTRRKGAPYQSAMPIVNFYINRAGKNLPKTRKRVLEHAKDELRDGFGRAYVERVVVNALAKRCGLPPDICAFGESTVI